MAAKKAPALFPPRGGFSTHILECVPKPSDVFAFSRTIAFGLSEQLWLGPTPAELEQLWLGPTPAELGPLEAALPDLKNSIQTQYALQRRERRPRRNARRRGLRGHGAHDGAHRRIRFAHIQALARHQVTAVAERRRPRQHAEQQRAQAAQKRDESSRLYAFL